MAKGTLLYGMESGSEEKGEMTPGRFIGRLFHAITAAHMLHLTTRNGTHHEALGTLYEDLLESADELAEVWQGLNGQLLEFTPCDFKVPTDALAYVTELCDCVLENKMVMGSEFVIQDLVGDVLEDISRAKYKLMFLS